MIINRETSEVSVLGDVEKHKVSIDEKNINHIVTILSSNLYSYPMESFLRETVSNAVDSHIEAGVNDPIIITLKDNEISIRDFGTGISPERFNEIYLNIGSSTKRETNEYIGSFGIGRFSALAISNIVNITSFYEGKAYYYVMNKDVTQLHIDLMCVTDTTEHNGVEVKVPLNRSIDSADFNCLYFIKNLYIDTSGATLDRNIIAIRDFNERKIATFKTFSIIGDASDFGYNHTILLGLIPYKINFREVFKNDLDTLSKWRDTFLSVIPHVEIGSVDITPNREQLIYTERTINTLQQIYKDVIKELLELYENQNEREIEDFKTWFDTIKHLYGNHLKLNVNNTYYTIKMPNDLRQFIKYKYRKNWGNIGTEYAKQIINNVSGLNIPLICTYFNDKISRPTAKRRYNRYNLGDLMYSSFRKVFLPSSSGFNSKYINSYIKEKYDDDNVFFLRTPNIDKRYLKRLCSEVLSYLSGSVDKKKNKTLQIFTFQVLRECIKYIKDNSEFTDIINSQEYKQYKKDNAEHKERVITDNIIFTIAQNTSEYITEYKVTNTFKELPAMLKRSNNDRNYRYVYCSLDNILRNEVLNLGMKEVIVISASKTNMKYFKDNMPKWIIPIEDLCVPTDKSLIKCKTANYIRKSPYIQVLSKYITGNIEDAFDPNDIKRIYALRTYMNIKGNGSHSALLDIIPKDVYDEHMLGEYKELEPTLENIGIIENISLYTHTYFALFYMMKEKKFRMAYRAYHKMKQLIKYHFKYENS